MIPSLRALGAGLLLALFARTAVAEPLELAALERRLDPAQPGLEHVGALQFRGALEITSPDPRFGGLSGLLVDSDGTALTAVSDVGHWVNARLRYDTTGRLVGIGGASIGPLLGRDGRTLNRKRVQDAESLATLADGSILVAFEQNHRIWRYPPGANPLAGVPTALPLPAGLAAAPSNQGIEALVTLPRDRVLAIAEDLMQGDTLAAFLWADGAWARLAYRAHANFKPTGAALLPDGDLVVLERQFTWLGGLAVRLVRVAADQLRAGGVLEGREIAVLRLPLTIDNMEGIAARRGAAGETLIYLVSDDNFSAIQRTLLLMFALAE